MDEPLDKFIFANLRISGVVAILGVPFDLSNVNTKKANLQLYRKEMGRVVFGVQSSILSG